MINQTLPVNGLLESNRKLLGMGYGNKYLNYVRKKCFTEVSKENIVVKKCVIRVGNSALREKVMVKLYGLH
jgi:hypothetical protein